VTSIRGNESTVKLLNDCSNQNRLKDAVYYAYVCNNFASAMEQVCNDHIPLIITRKNAESVIMMSIEDYNSMMETVYLLRSPRNAENLAKSIYELK
jgi:antitoxin YefM